MFGAILTQSCTMFHLCPFISIFSFPISAILSLTRWLLLIGWQVQPAVWVSNAPLSASAFCWVVPVTPLLLPGQAQTSTIAIHLSGFVSHEKSWKIRLASWTFGLTDQSPGWLFRLMASTLHVREKTWQLHYLYISHLMLVIWPIIIHDPKPTQIDSVSAVMLDT